MQYAAPLFFSSVFSVVLPRRRSNLLSCDTGHKALGPVSPAAGASAGGRRPEEAQRQLEEDGTLDDIEALISSMDGGELDSLMELRGGAAAEGGGFDEL